MGRFGYCLPAMCYVRGQDDTAARPSQSTHTIMQQDGLHNAYAADGIPGCESLVLDEIPVNGAHVREEAVVRDVKDAKAAGSPRAVAGEGDSVGMTSQASMASMASSAGSLGDGQEQGLSKSQGNGSASKPTKAGGARGRDSDAHALRQKLTELPGAELPGYMPLREDFDVEFDNDAELLLADMEFLPDDHPSERELKTQILRIYNAKLEEREKRKRFVIDRGLVDFKAAQAAERRRNKEERDLVARMRIFQRFQTAEEHDALVEGLLRARRLRKQIELYSHYRRMGVRTLDQARAYEQDRKRREGELKAKRQREDTPYLFAGTSHAASSSARGRGRSPRSGDADAPGSAPGGGGGGGSGANNGGDGTGLNMDRGPGSELLSTQELALCQALPMLPLHFLAVKDTLVREAFRNGTLSEDGLRRTTNLPPGQVTTAATTANDSARAPPHFVP